MPQSRGARGRAYVLITPANHYPSRLAELPGASVVKLVTPRMMPARLGLYIVSMNGGGGIAALVGSQFESFLYGLVGTVWIRVDGQEANLGPGAFVYVPPESGFEIRTEGAEAQFLWLKRRYDPAPGLTGPPGLRGHRDNEPFERTAVPGFTRRELIPADDPRYDFNMSLLAFETGVGLPQTEIHDEEHGLFMIEGEGTYHLDGERHQVGAGDFIYMAPYCPQSFVAGDGGRAEYLLYKDVYRDGF